MPGRDTPHLHQTVTRPSQAGHGRSLNASNRLQTSWKWLSDARKHWEKVLEEAIALPLIAQEMNLLLGDDVADTMDMAVARLTGNGRDPEVPVISAAMKNVVTTARTIGSGSIGVSGPRGAGKSTVLNKFDTRDAAWDVGFLHGALPEPGV